MKCRKNLSNPNVKDCMQCEYQDLCKMESILGSAKEISNIHTESTKGIMNKIDEIDTTAERKIGPLWNIAKNGADCYSKNGDAVTVLTWQS